MLMFGARRALRVGLLCLLGLLHVLLILFIYWISLRPAPTPTPHEEVATLLLSQDEVRLRCNFQCHFGRCCLPSTSGHLRPSRREKSAVSLWFPLTPGFTGFVVRVIKKTIVPNHCIELLACASLACYEALFGWVHLPGNPHAYIYNFFNDGRYLWMRRISRCDQKENHSVSRHVPNPSTLHWCTDAIDLHQMQTYLLDEFLAG